MHSIYEQHISPRGILQVGRLILVIGAAAVIGSGCDGSEQVAAELEEALRKQGTTEQKTGVLQALQTARTAREVARRAASPIEPSCALPPPERGPYTYRFSLELTRRGAGGDEQRWRETRTLRRDDDGDLGVAMDAGFVTELGLEGRRTPQWLVVGQASYVSVDGRAYYRRELVDAEPERLVRGTRATFQILLDAVPTGWSRSTVDDGASFTVGGARLVCGTQAPAQRGWLRRFETRATVLSGQVLVAQPSADAGRRRKLQLVSVERDRSLTRVDHLVEQLAGSGLIERSQAITNDSNDARP